MVKYDLKSVDSLLIYVGNIHTFLFSVLQKLASELKMDEKDLAMSNPTILRIDEMFTKLHAMLQLKHHQIIENVSLSLN